MMPTTGWQSPKNAPGQGEVRGHNIAQRANDTRPSLGERERERERERIASGKPVK